MQQNGTPIGGRRVAELDRIMHTLRRAMIRWAAKLRRHL
jgi:hypothetical protein